MDHMNLGAGICTRDVEFRLSDDVTGDGRTLEGYAAVFEQETSIKDFFGTYSETITPGAFRKTLRDRRGKVVCQFNHGRDSRTGSVPIGVFTELREDDEGLFTKARLFRNDAVEPVREAIAEGAINGMSFTFRVVRDEWRDAEGEQVAADEVQSLLTDPGDRGPLRRSLKEIHLLEAGPVVYPAYEGTSVGVRSVAELNDEDRAEIAAALRGEDSVTRAEDDDAKKPYGEVPYADPGYQEDGKKRYPIDTAAHVKAAWSYINQDKDAAKYGPEDLKKVKDKIKAAAKKFGIEISEDDEKSTEHDDVRDITIAGKKYPLTTFAEAETAWKAALEANAGDNVKAAIELVMKRLGGAPATKKPPEGNAAHASTLSTENPEKDAVLPEDTSHRERSKKTDTRGRKMNLEQLRARLAEIAERQTELGAEYADTELSDEAQREWDTLVSERPEVEKRIAAVEKRIDWLRELAQNPENVTHGTDRGTPAFHRRVDVHDVEGLRMASNSSEEFRGRLRDNALRFIETAKFARVVSRERAQDRASELIETYDDEDGWLAKRMLLTGSPLYERAFGKYLRHQGMAALDTEEQRAMSLGGSAGADGGFAVPVQLDPTVILTQDGHIGDLRRLARVETIVGKEWQGITSTGIAVSRDGSPAAGELGRVAEGTEASDGSFTLAQPKVEAVRVQGFVPFSVEIDQDWGGLRAEITRMLNDAKAREENESFTLGDGTGTQPGGVVGSLPAGSKVDGGATFTASDIYELETTVPPRFRGNAQWLANKAIYNLVRQFDTAGGAQLWEHIGGGLPARLLGYPVNENSYMDGTLTASSTNSVLLFGDFSQFLIVDRVGMSVELVPHVFGATNRFPTGQRGIYAYWRNNATVLVPGAFRLLQIVIA